MQLPVANIYNIGGSPVPNMHYSKAGVSPCYGFNAAYPGNTKINSKGSYEQSGGLNWIRDDEDYDLRWIFLFKISTAIAS